MKFNPGVIEMFMTKTGARFYAWRARRRGFKTEIEKEGNGLDSWILGGKYSVSLSKEDETDEG